MPRGSLPLCIDPGLPTNTSIISVIVLPIHVYDKDPHPEPWDGLIVETDDERRTFTISPSGTPRDSIDFLMWQLTYGYG